MVLSLIKSASSFATKSLENPYGIPLDLSYITEEILCCSFPTNRIPSKYYRNDINDLVRYLTLKHGHNWKMITLRTKHENEYRFNDEKYLKFPWKDHEGPPFTYLLRVLNSIEEQNKNGNVVIIHCRMGKGRSGLIVATYLMLKKGMSKIEAEDLFTLKRMTFGFGEGISIKSQMKYVEYMELYCKNQIYNHAFVPNIKITFIDFINNDDNVEIEISGYDIDENDIEPIKIKGCEFLIPNSERYTDIRVGLSMKLFGLKITSVYLWFNMFFELKLSDSNFKRIYSWEEFDGLKGTGKKGIKLFNKMEIQF